VWFALHEHDEEAADEGPDEVDRDLVLPDLVAGIRQRRPRLRIRHRHVGDGSGDGAARIALLEVGSRGRLGRGFPQLSGRW